MDKIAANNFIVSLRKDVKAAKAMVAGNLTRKIAQSKEEIDKKKDDQVQKAKIEAKIERVHAEIKLLKTIDNYSIAKAAMMKPDLSYWEKMIFDSKASSEDQLKARVISKTKVQKQVQLFRSQHVDCDEWLEEYFEFREKKQDLMAATQGGKKKKMRRDRVREARLKRQEQWAATKAKRSNISMEEPKDNTRDNTNEPEAIHPSWASKRREKELLKKAFAGIPKIIEAPSGSNQEKLSEE